MLKRLLVAFLLLFAAFNAGALEYTDVYFDPDEAGWGFFLVQSDTFQFIAFFIYGTDGKPTWYTAEISDDGTGTYTGALYASTGTFFAAPWQGYQQASAGMAKFEPIDKYHAKLTYTVDGVDTVIRNVQRQTLTSYKMAGNYSGSAAGSIGSCNDPTANEPSFRGRYALSVSQVGDASITLTFTFVDSNHTGIVCTVSGPVTHFGRLYQMDGEARCTSPGFDTGVRAATVDSLHPTGQGIEGRWTGSLGGGCQGVFHFSAVLNVNG
jgi:hypothetical protein